MQFVASVLTTTTMEMSENVLIALLTVAGSSLSSLALVNWRLKKLEEKVDKHNSYSDKIAAQTTAIACMQKDIEYIREKLS